MHYEFFLIYSFILLFINVWSSILAYSNQTCRRTARVILPVDWTKLTEYRSYLLF